MPEFKINAKRQELIEALIKNLPTYRKQLRLTQTELARVIGKSRQTVSDMERKVAPMGWDTYLAIIKVLEANNSYDGLLPQDLEEQLLEEIKIKH